MNNVPCSKAYFFTNLLIGFSIYFEVSIWAMQIVSIKIKIVANIFFIRIQNLEVF